MELKNLEKAIEELNAPIIEPAFDFEGVHYEKSIDPSFYEFKYKVTDNHILIYDNNEFFNRGLDDEIRSMCYYGSKEFRVEYKKPESTIDQKINLFTEALKKDLKRKDIIIEWQDYITLSVYIG